MVLTREYLATYVFLESEIKRIQRRIKYYEDHPLQKECEVVKGSLQQFPYTACHFVVSGIRPKSAENVTNRFDNWLQPLKQMSRYTKI